MQMSHKISVYVPSTINGNVPATASLVNKWLGITKNTMANLFGGFTAIPVQGGYVSPEHGLIEENITLVYAFTDSLINIDKIRDLARRMAKAMGQECVSVEFDNTVEFISPV